jgi:hypothetical protein
MTPIFLITIGDVLGFIILAVSVAVLAFLYIKQAQRQSRCLHDGGVRETMNCDAICEKCGKNLGFIGTWRKVKLKENT